MSQGWYIYCIIPNSDLNLEKREIQVISEKDIAAIASQVPLEEFEEEAFKTRIENDPKWLEEKVMQHNEIVSQIAAQTTVIPMKFGTVFKTEDAIKTMLKEKDRFFQEILLNLKGKDEWGVKVFCSMGKLKEYLLNSEQNIKDVAEAMKAKPEGVVYFLKRKMESLLTEASEEKLNEYAAAIHEELTKVSDKNCLNKLQPRELTKKEGEMILNGAYLVLKEKVNEFKSQVSNLQKTYADSGLELEISGPWPAYGFASMEGK